MSGSGGMWHSIGTQQFRAIHYSMSTSLRIAVLDELDLWDIPHVRVPERSRLHHLAPMGIGTPFVECLTSYLSRLAQAHHVLPKELIRQELQQHLPNGYRGQGLRGSQIYC